MIRLLFSKRRRRIVLNEMRRPNNQTKKSPSENGPNIFNSDFGSEQGVPSRPKLYHFSADLASTKAIWLAWPNRL
ncbi:hypothetical protein DERP_008996 [Dermatophagoides pteronyssinus]|uniref:Uncharacterized protein n=1 Tax=Dermatophagoides pteronyssinus TaxID=6956 RepID=A0ABQ8JG42_DERPT|nr:hypothetical protein DERP_008996 [Dermatophagoides pteronyssinus]